MQKHINFYVIKCPKILFVTNIFRFFFKAAKFTVAKERGFAYMRARLYTAQEKK